MRNKQPLLSIIIPIYNTEKYLSKCLDSIVSQTYKSLEIICIDDGSTDKSPMIIDDYASKDNRVVVIHQKNKGESKARNEGLKIAKGDYITLVDSDDWLELDMYEQLVAAAIENDADMAIGGWIKENPSGTEWITNADDVDNSVFGKEKLLEYLYKRDRYRLFAYMWDKIYRREVIYSEKRPIRLNENLSLGGDVQFLGEAALNTNVAVYVDKSFYHYRQLEVSMCHTDKFERWRDWINSYEILIKEFKEDAVDNEIIDYLKRFMVYHSCEAAEVAIGKKDKGNLNYFKECMGKYKAEYFRLNSDYLDRIERYEKIMISEV